MKRLHKLLKKYFFPHEGNNYKPHLLRQESVFLFLLLIIVVELGFLVQVFVVFDKTKFLASVLPGVLASITNDERAQNDALPLKESALLDKAAELKAEDMATKGYFAHTSPEGKTPWYWFEQVGYLYTFAGENLAVNFFESEDVAKAWMNSPTHRANIVKKDYTEIGIGVANGIYQGKSTVFVAQLFAKPIAIALAEFTPEPIIAPSETPPKAVTPAPKPTPVPKPIPAPVPPTTPKVSNPTPPQTPPVSPTAITVLGEELDSSAAVAGGIAKGQSVAKSFIQRVLSSPRQPVGYVFGGMGLLVVIVLLLMLFIKSELRHPAILARGVALVAVIIVLSFVNLRVSDTETLVPESGLSANVIEALPQ